MTTRTESTPNTTDSTPPPEETKFGTFGGVFTPTILTILGVILFMRANFVVGQAGIRSAILMLGIAKALTFLTSLSISAIATNMKMKGGGAYYLISRVLGPEFGGAIGIALFIATALSVPFYVFGFSEALSRALPSVEPWLLAINLGAVSLLFIVAFVGAKWAIKAQYVIMAILGLSILTFMGGMATHFSWDQFLLNLQPDYSAVDAENPQYGNFSFWTVFAIYFPAVTGILAGVNMSGDLKDPGKSIPKGTILAIVAGAVVYLSVTLLSGGAFERHLLKTQPYDLLMNHALFGMGFLVTAGVFAATLSSALGSYLGAPRVLQAVSRDPILTFLKPFSKGSAETDEPQRALLFTGAIAVGIVLWAHMNAEGDALNALAAVISMFFLYTYGLINLAAFVEAFGHNPSFRPEFKLFHWSTALLGGLGCLWAAFLINALAAVVAALLISLLYIYLKTKSRLVGFSDARRGFVYSSVRKSLIKLSATTEDSKNWRPTILLFSGNPTARETLVTYAFWLGAGRGIVYLADILIGDLDELYQRRLTAIKRLKDFCTEKKIPAFPLVVIENSVEKGVSTLLQTAGSGLVPPNTALFGWSDNPEALHTYIKNLHQAYQMGMSLLIVHSTTLPVRFKQKTVDIWWRGRKNGSLMMLLSHLLTDNASWKNATVRVFRVVESDDGVLPAQTNLNDIIRDARIQAKAKVLVHNGPFEPLIQYHSKSSDCVFLGFEVPEEGSILEWHQQYVALIADMPTTVLVCANSQEDLLDY